MNKEKTTERLLQLISDKLGVDAHALTLKTSFSDDLGTDSLDVYELIMATEKEFGIKINDEDAEKLTTVGLLADYINNSLGHVAPAAKPIVAPEVKEELASATLDPVTQFN
ncbi:acyl carrier protein [Ferruginibacter albus]|uniref:acyl carrier protein n=1 Tax=Ferruginibacter albus TaxID=2875540 RepID=UPI0036F312EC|nr:acyl carrier protein [Ferruginibacter albus]